MWRGSDHERGGQLILGINVQFTHIKHTLANGSHSHSPALNQQHCFCPKSQSSRGEGGSGRGPEVPTFDGVFWEHFVTCLTTLTLHLVSHSNHLHILTDWLTREEFKNTKCGLLLTTVYQIFQKESNATNFDMMRHWMTKTTNWHVQSKPTEAAFKLSDLFLTCPLEDRKKKRKGRTKNEQFWGQESR